MAKTKGPAFSLTASGTIGNALTYQKNKAGKYVRGYNKPSGPPSINQETIRQYTKEAVTMWHWLTDDERELWNQYVMRKAIEDNLAALWPMNEGSGVVLPGHSKYRIQGNITEATWVDGKFRKALYFDGNNDFVNCGQPASVYFGTGNFTIEFWIKTTQTDLNYKAIISQWQYGKGYWVQLSPSARYVMFGWRDNDSLTGSILIKDGEWHHVMCIRTGDKSIKTYIDNVLDIDGDVGNGGNIDSVGADLKIANMDLPLRFFNGTLDEIALYNRALTPTEVKQRAERKAPGITFPTGTMPTNLMSPEAYSGYHCFIAQFTKNRMQGISPWRLPTGVYF